MQAKAFALSVPGATRCDYVLFLLACEGNAGKPGPASNQLRTVQVPAGTRLVNDLRKLHCNRGTT
jgi:hypothetical protein